MSARAATTRIGVTLDRRSERIDDRVESVVGDRLDRGDNGWAERTLDEGLDHELRAIPGHRHSRVARHRTVVRPRRSHPKRTELTKCQRDEDDRLRVIEEARPWNPLRSPSMDIPVEVAADHPHLLSALREELGVTSPKDGCSPSGQCGACTVLLDGKAIQSCLVSMEKAEGKSVTTLEGLRGRRTEAARRRLCLDRRTPMRILHAWDSGSHEGADRSEGRRPRPKTRQAASERTSVAAPDTRRSSKRSTCSSRTTIPPPRTPERVGDSGAKYEGVELALGDRGYVDDIRPEGLLHGALRLTDHARADVIASTHLRPRPRRCGRCVHRCGCARQTPRRDHPRGLAGVHP